MFGRHALLAPQVVQTSAMDCGPAALKSAMHGHGIDVNYARLRDACQTDVDGTSIDTLEDIANDLGLDAVQTVIPRDHVAANGAESLPAIAVTRLPTGAVHFVVVWRRVGARVQLMDPARGRVWMHSSELRELLHEHEAVVPAEAWLEWARGAAFGRPLLDRLRRLGLSSARGGALVEAARIREGWRSLASLDAATRLLASLVDSGAVSRGRDAERLLRRVWLAPDTIPASFWTVREAGTALRIRGAVVLLLRPRGTAAIPTLLRPDAVAEIRAPEPSAAREIWHQLGRDGLGVPLVVVIAAVLAGAGVLTEALLFRGLIDFIGQLGLGLQRAAGVGLVVAFATAVTLISLVADVGELRIGRRLDARLRIALFEKLRRLPVHYFQSRLDGDLAERSHYAHRLRSVPTVIGDLVSTGGTLALTVVAVCWLAPSQTVIALSVGAVALALPLLGRRVLALRDLKLRTLSGALSGHQLDALLGAVPVRAHGGGPALTWEHESVLEEWSRASHDLLRASVMFSGVQQVLGLGLAAWLVVSHVAAGGGIGSVLLLAYWALSIPALGQAFAHAIGRSVLLRSATLRILEPLRSSDADSEATPTESWASADDTGGPHRSDTPVALEFRGVEVRAAGHVILRDVDLSIAPGEHVAIVGASGSGKTSLLSLLLGWHQPRAGWIGADGLPLRVADLRRDIAWVDPSVRLWNASLYDNILYGADEASAPAELLDAAQIGEVLERMPEGLQTSLGEGGALVSGGEGQRIRFARALGRTDARLVLLDEPFRGLDRNKRGEMLERARAWWLNATLMCVTHDIESALTFDRVIVLDGGRVVEDGCPATLRATEDSRFARLLSAEQRVLSQRFGDPTWRRVQL